MTEASIAEYIATFPGVEATENFGYTFFFYGEERKLPFATIASSDNDYDRVSQLDRPGVFRLNLGLSRETFQSLFDAAPLDGGSYDYAALDVIVPHPDYAPQHYICVLNPSEATWERLKPLLKEAYDLSRKRAGKRDRAPG